MTDLDELVRRGVDSITTIAGRAARFTGRVLLGVTAVCAGGFLLGVAALSDGIEQVWIVLGTVFGAIAVIGTFRAWWRLGSVARHAPELADELRELLGRGDESTRTVIETFGIDADGAGPRTGGTSAIVWSRQMHGFGDLADRGTARPPRLGAAVRAVTGLPVLVLPALLITAVFGFLGVIFLVALAL